MKKLVSIVIPCYNEEEVLPETLFRLLEFTTDFVEYDFELIFVDDGSTDRTREILLSSSLQNPLVKPVFFSRNFGHQIAVSAGVDSSSGDAVVLIDADLQDPISTISIMLTEWENGFDVVYGVRKSRVGESKFKVMSARAFYRILNKLSDVPIPLDTGDFRLMSRRVVDVISAMPESDRFIRGMVSWVGFNQKPIFYERAQRFAGQSKYPLRKMIRFATDGIMSFSNKPLKLATHFGIFCAGLSLFATLGLVMSKLNGSDLVPGWASTLISIFFLGGVQLICFGLLGEYVGRIYNEVKKRPLYILDENPDQLSKNNSALDAF